MWGAQEAGALAGQVEQRGKRQASQESDDAVRDRQELETWNREASREELGSWANAKDLEQQPWDNEQESKERLGNNWGQADSSTRSEGTAHSLDNSREPESARVVGVPDAAGEFDKAARSASEAARARTAAQDYAGRRAGAYNAGSMSSSTGAGSGAPCGACKFLRRKCVRGCIFAPYFGAEQGAAKFAAVHKVFGASNVAKLLLHIPAPRRSDAVLTISYEAQARLSDPVYGCVATIFALQQQVASLQQELAMVQTQLADRHTHLHQAHHQQHHQQQRMVAFGSPATQAPDYMQQHLGDHSHLSPTAGLSMGMPGGSGSGQQGPYSHSRVKEEGSYFQGMQQQQHQHHYDMGMPSSSLEPMATEQSLLESLQKSRSGGMGDQPDEGELQALASLLRRK